MFLSDSNNLGPPVERLEQGYPFCVVYFSRGTLPQKKGKRALLGDLATSGGVSLSPRFCPDESKVASFLLPGGFFLSRSGGWQLVAFSFIPRPAMGKESNLLFEGRTGHRVFSRISKSVGGVAWRPSFQCGFTPPGGKPPIWRSGFNSGPFGGQLGWISTAMPCILAEHGEKQKIGGRNFWEVALRAG